MVFLVRVTLGLFWESRRGGGLVGGGRQRATSVPTGSALGKLYMVDPRPVPIGRWHKRTIGNNPSVTLTRKTVGNHGKLIFLTMFGLFVDF